MSKVSGFRFLVGVDTNFTLDSSCVCLYETKNNEVISMDIPPSNEIMTHRSRIAGELIFTISSTWQYASFLMASSFPMNTPTIYAMFKNTGQDEGTFIGFTDDPQRLIKVHELQVQYQSAVQERDEQVRDLNQAVDQLGSMLDWI